MDAEGLSTLQGSVDNLLSECKKHAPVIITQKAYHSIQDLYISISHLLRKQHTPRFFTYCSIFQANNLIMVRNGCYHTKGITISLFQLLYTITAQSISCISVS
jgi:hypothetical protein